MQRILLSFACVLSEVAWGQPARLDPGKVVEKQIPADGEHVYRFHVDAGEFLYVKASQVGIDLSLTLTGPDEKVLTVVNRTVQPSVEDLHWIAGSTGDYQIAINANKSPASGDYRLELQQRAATAADRNRFQAFTASWMEGQAIQKEGQSAAVKQRAIQKLEEALAAWRSAGEASWEAWTLHELGFLYQSLTQMQKARDTLALAAIIRRRTDERSALGTTLSVLGVIQGRMGNYEQEEANHQEALQIRTELGDRKGEGVTLNNLALLYVRLGDPAKAEEAHLRSLAIRREVGDKSGEATTLSNLAAIYRNRGDLKRSLQSVLDALTIRRGLGDKRNEATSLLGVGINYMVIGEKDRAIDYFRQAASTFDQIGDMLSLASTQYLTGHLIAQAGDNQKSLPYYERALELRRKAASQLGEASTLSGMCASLIALERQKEAGEGGERSLMIARQIKHLETQGTALTCLGRVALKNEKPEQASRHFAEATGIFRTIQDNDSLAIVLTFAAMAERDRGNLDAATPLVEEAMALGESARRSVNTPGQRASYRALTASRFDLYTSILMQQHAKHPAAGFDIRAFEFTEGGRARTLTEMLADNRVDQELTESQQKRQQELAKRIATLQKDLFRAGVPLARQTELKRELATTVRDLDLFEFELQHSTQYPNILESASIRKQVTKPGTALVEYALGDKESYAWVVTAEGLVSTVLPGRKEIEDRVNSYRKELASRVTTLTVGPALARLDAGSRQLYKMLVAPLEKALVGSKTLIIVPDGILSYLPFETLLGQSRMIERFAISYTPSASALAQLRERETRRAVPTKTLLAFADPVYSGGGKKSAPAEAMRERGFDFTQLPNTRNEVTGIQALYKPGQSQVFLGAAAKEETLKNNPADSFRYLHFATHGYLDEEQHWRSGIVFSLNSGEGEDGVLQASEIMKLKLNADMVTLSACQTGLGKVLAGEGVLGLSRAFLYAGAQSLVVSLWNVNDAATADLMTHFYGNLKRGLGRDEALRQAKLGLMKTSSAWRHPYYWAPFVFLGDAGVAK